MQYLSKLYCKNKSKTFNWCRCYYRDEAFSEEYFTRIAFKKAGNGSLSIRLIESFFLSIHTATPSLECYERTLYTPVLLDESLQTIM